VSGDFPEDEDLDFHYWRERLPDFRGMHQPS